MRVGILFDAGSENWDQRDVAAVVGNAREIKASLQRRGYEATLVPVAPRSFGWLSRARRSDLIFNLCEGVDGHSKFEDYVVGTLELAGVPYTGCRPWPVSVCHRKHVANTLLAGAGVPIPRFALARGNKIPPDLTLPAIVKPAAEDASVGIDAGAVCTTKKALRKRIALMAEQHEEVMVQEYVAGREFNVGFVGGRVLPLSELCFDNMPEGSWPILTYAAKWNAGSPEDLGSVPVCPANVPTDLARRIVATAVQAWEFLCQGEGYGRVDLRVDAAGQPWVLEVNPNADLSSDAGLARMARAQGWSYDELVVRVAEEALNRSHQRRAAAALVGGAVA